MSGLMTSDADLLFILVMCVLMALFIGIHLGRAYQVIMGLGGLIMARERIMTEQNARLSRSRRYRAKKNMRKNLIVFVKKAKRLARVTRVVLRRESRGVVAQVLSLRPMASTINAA